MAKRSARAYVRRARMRNGTNTILLDMVAAIGRIEAELKAQGARLAVVEPALWKLEGDRRERVGGKAMLGRLFTATRLAWAAAGGVATWFGSHFVWPKLP